MKMYLLLKWANWASVPGEEKKSKLKGKCSRADVYRQAELSFEFSKFTSTSFVLTKVIILVLQGYHSFSPWIKPLLLFSQKEVDFPPSLDCLFVFWSMCAAPKTVPKNEFRFDFAFIVFQINRTYMMRLYLLALAHYSLAFPFTSKAVVWTTHSHSDS